VKGSGNIGVWGVSSGQVGVEGDHTSGGIGVLGTTLSSSKAGVEGDNYGSGPAVYGNCLDGTASGTGVQGASESGTGVAGSSTSDTGISGTSDGGIGVSGTTTSPAGGSPAIQGVNSGSGPGVVGFSGRGTGLSGGTGIGTGLAGIASSTGNGVVGQSAGGNAVTGIATGASNLAGLFQGPVWIVGGLAVQGAKNAVVRGGDGRLQRLYSLECPESWFEDFGSNRLSNGSATVELEPGFVGVVKTDQYRVFPVPKGDCKGLYVSSQTPTSFTAHELQGGTSNVAFDYRVVAKRRDIEGVRLEHVGEPPTVELLKLPELPPTPPAPATPLAPGAGR
jgi:hypothetical protein